MDLRGGGLQWRLDPKQLFLNHGSFGAVPLELEQERQRWQRALEQDPVSFLVEQLPGALASAKGSLARFLGADSAGLAFVPSTTYGLNELLSQLELPAGSGVLLGLDAYNATANIVEHWAARRGWTVRRAQWPLPLPSTELLLEAYGRELAAGVELLVLDHITSPTALWQPLDQLLPLARSHGARVIVDGAHGPGSVPLELDKWAAAGMDAYVGNLHKWLCCPRGSAFLWVADPWRAWLRPLVISHGANAPAGELSRFQQEHDWIGTHDPSAYLCLPKALELLGLAQPGAQQRLLDQRRSQLLAVRQQLQQALGRGDAPPLVPAEGVASMVALDLGVCDPLAVYRFFRDRRLQVPVIPLVPHQAPSRSFLRLSWFAYNEPSDLELLAQALGEAASYFEFGAQHWPPPPAQH
jgi:isopenicillin-N epimerase